VEQTSPQADARQRQGRWRTLQHQQAEAERSASAPRHGECVREDDGLRIAEGIHKFVPIFQATLLRQHVGDPEKKTADVVFPRNAFRAAAARHKS